MWCRTLRGTVRVAALLSRQPPGVLDQVRQTMRDRLAIYAEPAGLRVPIAVVVVRAVKPRVR